jgi:hypothetical protein
LILTKDVSLRRYIALQVPIEGFFWTNPSVVRTRLGYACAVKGVNYDRESIYYSGDWQALDPDERLAVKNVILTFDRDFNTTSMVHLDTSAVSENQSNTVEDIRLFHLDNKLMAIGTFQKYIQVRSGNRWISNIDAWRVFIAEVGDARLVNAIVLDSPVGAKIEKNWIPCVRSSADVELIANVNTGARMALSYEQDGWVSRPISGMEDFRWTDGWSGSSCVAPYSGGGVCIIHRRTRGMPYLYKHMVLVLDGNMNAVRRSQAFSFEGSAIEFCCGLDIDETTDAAIVTYGRFDKVAILIELSLADMLALADLPVNRCLPLSGVAVEHNIEQAEAVKVIGGHERTIWRLLDELAIAQHRIAAAGCIEDRALARRESQQAKTSVLTGNGKQPSSS